MQQLVGWCWALRFDVILSNLILIAMIIIGMWICWERIKRNDRIKIPETDRQRRAREDFQNRVQEAKTIYYDNKGEKSWKECMQEAYYKRNKQD